MKRKGWHRKKRRLRHDHKTQAIGTLRNQCRKHYARWVEELFAGDTGESPLLSLADFDEAVARDEKKREAFKTGRRLGKPTMQLARRMYMEGELTGPLMVPMSREELLEMYPPRKP